MTTVHMRYSNSVADATRDMRQRAWCEEDLGGLQRRVMQFSRILIKTFDEHRDSRLYALWNHLLDYVVEALRNFATLSVLDSSPYEQFNLHIMQAYKRM